MINFLTLDATIYVSEPKNKYEINYKEISYENGEHWSFSGEIMAIVMIM
jgi:hypothetical protein